MTKKVDTIPIEIYESLNQREIGYSLLIKGDAGAGKTTLALSLLTIIQDAEPIYISTRVAPQSLYAQFPWIQSILKEENVLDATRTYFPPVNNPGKLKTHLLRTMKFNDAPEFLKIVYDKIGEYENAVIIVDSWDAIIGNSEASQEWETMFTEIVRQLNIKLILISEREKTSFLDYIVDGIVTLYDNEYGNRVLREMEINKIRSIERRQKRYSYTLSNNEFMYCSPYHEINNIHSLDTPKVNSKWKVVEPQSNHSTYSTGNPEIDKLYQGGLKVKSLNLWEIDSDVPLNAFSHIIVPVICNFVSQNMGTIIYTAEGINSRFIDKNKLFVYLEMDKIRKYVRYLVESIGDERLNSKYEALPYVVPFSPSKFKEQFTETYVELAELSSYSPIISVVGYDFLNLRDQSFSELSSEFYNHLKFVRNYNSIEIAIVNSLATGNSQQSFIENISYLFNTHVKMIFKNNVILIYGIKPYTGLWWCKIEPKKNHPLAKITLIPMV